jgi:hypothetical protein
VRRFLAVRILRFAYLEMDALARLAALIAGYERSSELHLAIAKVRAEEAQEELEAMRESIRATEDKRRRRG